MVLYDCFEVSFQVKGTKKIVQPIFFFYFVQLFNVKKRMFVAWTKQIERKTTEINVASFKMAFPT